MDEIARADDGPNDGGDMFVEEMRAAVQTAPRMKLAELAGVVWRAFGVGAIGESDAQALAEAIEARKALPAVPAYPKWVRSGSRPRTSASLERRRSWAAGSWMPPAIAAGFTQAESAALAVIIREIATTGRCGLPMGAVAARAGVGLTSTRNAVREARKRGILHVEERRVSRDRNLPNVLTIVSRELALWVRTRARIDRRGGGVKSLAPTTIHLFHSSSQPSPATRKTGQPMRWASLRVEESRGCRGSTGS